MGGVLFRSLSAPRTIRLIPYARPLLLLALLLATGSAGLFVTANAALLTAEAPTTALARASLASVFVAVLSGETIAILGAFVFSSSPRAAILLVSAFVIAQSLVVRLAGSFAALTSGSLTGVGAVLVGSAWLCFALWYLRARRIMPLNWSDASWATGGLGAKREERVVVSRESAVTVQLLGLSSVTRVALRGGLTTGFVLLVLTLSLLRPDGSLAFKAGGVVLFCAFIVVLFQAVAVAWGIARRSRLLWIQSGYTRDELFRLCERLSWRCLGATSAPLLALCVAVWTFLPHAANDWSYLLAATVLPAVCGLYLGLMNVQGWRIIDVALAILIILTGMGGVMTRMDSVTPFQPAWVSIPAAEFFGALALRMLAQQRWRRIDWLICKPQRISSQALRPVM